MPKPEALSFFFLSSTVALAVTVAWAAGRPYIYLGVSGLETFAWHPGCGDRSQSL